MQQKFSTASRQINFYSCILSMLAIVLIPSTGYPQSNDVTLLPEIKTIQLGVIDGPEADIWKTAKMESVKYGLKIKMVYFSDFNSVNDALNSGAIDANAFQHVPYLDEQISAHGYKLTPVGNMLTFPIGCYSKKIKNLDQLKPESSIGIPNDPTNETRALNLLAFHNLIKLKHAKDINATVLDIAENPKNLKIYEIDSGALTRMIADFDAIVVNTVWALPAGLNPKTDAIAWESSQNNPYTNVIVVRTQDKDQPWVKILVSSYHTDSVRKKVQDVFGPTAVFSW